MAGCDRSRPYILPTSFGRAHLIAPRCFCALLLILLLAGCSGAATPTPMPSPLQAGDIPSYPNVTGAVSSLDSRSFPQAGQYDSVRALTFSSPDDSATIRLWYKDQLTAKGWQVVADGSSLLGLTTTNRDKLIELFLSSSTSGVNKTKVVAFYATGRKPTPTP
ncbi:MAG: hypothetical protein DLM69_05090 [Candidatus Chloroheliales bacterium]|nr:MAG: hypothetical protein DLM69_05090 [Chloroflexota bacterium]